MTNITKIQMNYLRNLKGLIGSPQFSWKMENDKKEYNSEKLSDTE